MTVHLSNRHVGQFPMLVHVSNNVGSWTESNIFLLEVIRDTGGDKWVYLGHDGAVRTTPRRHPRYMDDLLTVGCTTFFDGVQAELIR